MMRIPFAFDLSDGFVSIRGTVTLEGDAVVFETERLIVNLVPFGRRTIRLSVDDVEEVRIEEPTLRRPRLVVKPFDFVRVRDFPGDPPGALVLPIAKKHRAAAEMFAREVHLRNLPR